MYRGGGGGQEDTIYYLVARSATHAPSRGFSDLTILDEKGEMPHGTQNITHTLLRRISVILCQQGEMQHAKNYAHVLAASWCSR